MIKLILVLFCISSVGFAAMDPSAAADSTRFTQKCYDFKDTGAVYCVNRVHKSTSKDVLYFFHGLFMKPQDWPLDETIYTRVSKNWFNMQENAPIVISISYGPVWLAIKKNSSTLSGRLSEIAERVIPGIERSLSLEPTNRFVLGASMGGFSTAQLVLQYPHLFNRVALVCPAISSLSPYATNAQTNDFIDQLNQRNIGVRKVHLILYQILAGIFMNFEEEWQRVSVLKLIENRTEPLPPFLISTGKEDQYGFFEGSFELAKIMQQQNRNVHWYPVHGGHCSFDGEAVRRFLFE